MLHASSKRTSFDDTTSEVNLLTLNSTVTLFLEPEHIKQFVTQTSQGRTAGDTQLGLCQPFWQFCFRSFFAITCECAKKVPPSEEEYTQLQEHRSEVLL